MAEQVSVHGAKTRLSELLIRVEQGEKFVTAWAGKPVARLHALARPRVELHFLPDVSLPDDFFDPMTEEELALWHRPL